MRKHVHKWETLRRGFPVKVCRCGFIKALGLQSGEHTLSMDGNLLKWSASQDTGDIKHVGMDIATGRLRCFVGGAAKSVMVDGDGFTGPLSRINSLGGYDILLTSGEALAQGNIVVIGAADLTVIKCPTGTDMASMPLGSVFAGVDASAPVWVTVAGPGYALPTAAVTATRGNVIVSSSTTAGCVDQDGAIPVIATHMRECGHWLAAGSGNGVATVSMMHFN